MVFKLSAYIGLPHALLHILAYRLIGKDCVLDLNQRRVHSLEERTPKEAAFVKMFPTLAIGGLAVILLIAWAVTIPFSGYGSLATYYRTADLWHQAIWWIGIAILMYAGMGILHLYWGIRILLGKPSHSPPHQPDEHLSSRDEQHYSH